MEKLWSPWRSNYIDSFKEEKSGECIFCLADKQDLSLDSCLKVLDLKYSYVILNLYPYNSGHLMIVPRRHLSEFDQLTGNELSEMMTAVKLSMKALNHVMKPQGFNIGANLGKAAGAGIDDHLHFHIVPRWNGDINFMPALGEVKIISQDLLQTKKNLVEAFKNLI
ncbi:MAG TPA: HIT domain-containing protein [Melioribacteraceae bacterium]|nr:HIT domain-containing protein [Melioribacteraceae bacterium]